MQNMRTNPPQPYGQPYRLSAAPSRAAPAPSFNMWAEGYAYAFDDETGPFDVDGHSAILYVGADYLVSPYLLIGALAQYDDSEQDIDTIDGTIDSTGWMAGPYGVLRMNKNLYFQARAAWGGSDTELRLGPDLAKDRFDSDRWLVKGTLLGQWQSGPWQFRPRASIGYIEEDQEAYTNSLGVAIPGQKVSIGQAKAGPEVAYRFRYGNVVLEPSLLVEGIWNFDENLGTLKVDDLVSDEEVRARAEAGLTILSAGGMSLGAAFSYDGIGSDFQAIGGKARVRVPIN
jgi:outer membrane autotransporter protein